MFPVEQDRYLKFKMPMAPSVNKCYATNFNTGRRFPSKELNQFKADCQRMAIKHRKFLFTMSNTCAEWIKDSNWIEVSMYIVLPKETIYTKKDTVKILDASNFIKPIHDALADLIQIDDCYFSCGSVEKVVNDVDKEKYIQIVLKPQRIQTASTLDI